MQLFSGLDRVFLGGDSLGFLLLGGMDWFCCFIICVKTGAYWLNSIGFLLLVIGMFSTLLVSLINSISKSLVLTLSVLIILSFLALGLKYFLESFFGFVFVLEPLICLAISLISLSSFSSLSLRRILVYSESFLS